MIVILGGFSVLINLGRANARWTNLFEQWIRSGEIMLHSLATFIRTLHASR